MQALIENRTLEATDLMIKSKHGISILSASFARQVVANPERLEDIRKTVANPKCMGFFEDKREDAHTSDGDDHTSGPGPSTL